MTLLSFPTGPELRVSKMIMRIKLYEMQIKKENAAKSKQ